MSKKSKIWLVPVCIVAVIAVLTGCGLAWMHSRPDNPLITVQQVSQSFDHYGTGGTDMQIVLNGKKQEIAVDGTLCDLLVFDRWERTDDTPKGEPEVVFEFQELWEIAFYPEGTVRVSDGYGPIDEVNTAHYRLPEGVVEDLVSYCQSNTL